jgi:hypothetical protein
MAGVGEGGQAGAAERNRGGGQPHGTLRAVPPCSGAAPRHGAGAAPAGQGARGGRGAQARGCRGGPSVRRRRGPAAAPRRCGPILLASSTSTRSPRPPHPDHPVCDRARAGGPRQQGAAAAVGGFTNVLGAQQEQTLRCRQGAGAMGRPPRASPGPAWAGRRASVAGAMHLLTCAAPAPPRPACRRRRRHRAAPGRAALRVRCGPRARRAPRGPCRRRRQRAA